MKRSKPANSVLAMLLAFWVIACSSQRAVAQTAEALGDGDKGAMLGTLIYNTWINPAAPLPLPYPDDEVLKKTLQNLGAGQCLGDAWNNAAASAASFEAALRQSRSCNALTPNSNDGAPSPQPSPQPGPHPGDATSCVAVDTRSNSISSFLINNCGKAVTVVWTDQGSCRNWTCTELGVPAHGRSSITPIRGQYELGACWAGELATAQNGRVHCNPGDQSTQQRATANTAASASVNLPVNCACDDNPTKIVRRTILHVTRSEAQAAAQTWCARICATPPPSQAAVVLQPAQVAQQAYSPPPATPSARLARGMAMPTRVCGGNSCVTDDDGKHVWYYFENARAYEHPSVGPWGCARTRDESICEWVVDSEQLSFLLDGVRYDELKGLPLIPGWDRFINYH
jgi:hypothetical protein